MNRSWHQEPYTDDAILVSITAEFNSAAALTPFEVLRSTIVSALFRFRHALLIIWFTDVCCSYISDEGAYAQDRERADRIKTFRSVLFDVSRTELLRAFLQSLHEAFNLVDRFVGASEGAEGRQQGSGSSHVLVRSIVDKFMLFD